MKVKLTHTSFFRKNFSSIRWIQVFPSTAQDGDGGKDYKLLILENIGQCFEVWM